MNYIMALAFVMTSLLSPFLSVCEIAPCQRSYRSSERKEFGRKEHVQGFQNQVSTFSFYLSTFQDFGIFMGHYFRRRPFDVICRKHTVQIKLTKAECPAMWSWPRRWRAKRCDANGIQHLWELHTINNGTGLWNSKTVVTIIL